MIDTSRRAIIAGLAGALAGAAAPALAKTELDGEITIAEEHFARMIAFWHLQGAADAKGTGPEFADSDQSCLGSDGLVEAHWRSYVGAARAVLRARA